MHKLKLLALLIALATQVVVIAACGSKVTDQQAQQFANNKDVQILKKKADACLQQQGGVISLRSKDGRHKLIDCVAPAGKKVQAQQCAAKNLKIVFSKKKLKSELMTTIDCIARL